MVGIASPMSIIDPNPPAQDSSSVRLHHDDSDSDTFCLLSETPAATLTMSMDAFSILIFLCCLIHALQLLSKLFIGPPRPSLSVCFINFRALCPSSVRIDGTVFLSFSVELLPKIGTLSEMERKRKCKTAINTTINHWNRTTTAQMKAGAVMGTGADGDGEENTITMSHLQQECHFG